MNLASFFCMWTSSFFPENILKRWSLPHWMMPKIICKGLCLVALVHCLRCLCQYYGDGFVEKAWNQKVSRDLQPRSFSELLCHSESPLRFTGILYGFFYFLAKTSIGILLGTNLTATLKKIFVYINLILITWMLGAYGFMSFKWS